MAESDLILPSFFIHFQFTESDLLMPRTRQELLRWRKHLEWMRHRKKILNVKSDYVFCRLDGTPLKRFYSAWKQALEKAGIDNLHFHDLRHTFCSNIILSGSDLKGANDMIGHKDINMTNRYSHLPNAYRQSIQKQLHRHYQRNE